MVPSNASPLIGTDRILRDTSGNTGFIYTVRERQSDFDIPTGPKHHARNHVQQYMREGRGSSAYGRNDVGFHRPGFLHSHESIYCPRLDAQGNPPNNFQRTYGALTADEIPRYREYRQRTRKDIGQDGQPVWPDALEEAFQIGIYLIYSLYFVDHSHLLAIRDIPPVLGKKKLQVRGPDGSMKLCGRNELLSKKIFQLTGILRTRKQISSHIQVIRGFLRKGNNSKYEDLISTLKRVQAHRNSDEICVYRSQNGRELQF